MAVCQRRPFGLQGGQGRWLVIPTARLLPRFAGRTPSRQPGVVQPAALRQREVEQALLLLGRLEALLEGRPQAVLRSVQQAYCHVWRWCRRRAAGLSSPCLKAGAFSSEER